MWGVDILGLFTPTDRQIRYLIVAVDYFTKWIEAEAVASISSEK
ncbi:RNA-directed DNA polymerase (Reverse transcriptase), partial [Trifolium medium]|nr:RNA-directed DNA polymerase (Reverse transcriptase) [Trifolium medium]